MRVKYRIQKGLIVQKLGEETVIFDADQSVLYNFNKTAGEIFGLMKKGLSEEEIIEKMVKKYQVKKERVAKDVKELINNLKKKKIVVIEVVKK